MIIKSLSLENYRNYDHLDIDFKDKTNILYGDNAQGKTNILESIYMCSHGKSHRNSKDKEIIKIGKNECHIKLDILKKDIPYRIDIHLRKSKTKGIAINRMPLKKISELFGIANFILFSPEDLNIIKNGPSERRKFLNIELCMLNSLYVNSLINYNKVLNQRNTLLKELRFNDSKELYDTLDIWDEQLIKFGKDIIREREKFIVQLKPIIESIHKNISGGKENLNIEYEKNTSVESFEKDIKQSRKKDIQYKMTLKGPHRDDIGFYINGLDIRKYGSQGQQRSGALSLKLSEIELIKKLTNDNPVLLLDDVMSELDSKRQNNLLESINDIQTIITCTGIDDLINKRLKIDNIYKIVQGTAKIVV
ncbi:DNA replication and repair protein RecF [Lachnospiraceae bacterium RM5]|nr:DNA replication and repair protein RecF [Lachnospiraceae bacterium RM5]